MNDGFAIGIFAVSLGLVASLSLILILGIFYI